MAENANQEAALRFAMRSIELAKKDPEIGAMMPDAELPERMRAEDRPLDKMQELLFTTYRDRPAMAERPYSVGTNPKTGENERRYENRYEAASYGEVWEKAKAVAMAWRKDPSLRIEQDTIVAIVGFAGTEYFILDLATNLSHTITAPLQSKTSDEDFEQVFKNTNPSVLAASVADLVTAAEHAVRHGDIPNMIVFDYDERVDSERQIVEQAREIIEGADRPIRLLTFAELLEIGQSIPWEDLPVHSEGENRTVLLLHSSGSTGKPKGAVMNERTIKQHWIPGAEPIPITNMVFAPFNHGMGRLTLFASLLRGSLSYFTLKSDMSSLFEDIRIARPTYISFFPRIMDMIYQHFQNEVSSRMASGSQSRFDVEEDVKVEMKHSFLGDRFLGATVGSAPTQPAVKEFLVDCFDVFLSEGYANTETGAGALTRDDIIQRPPVIDYKLRDVPELGYYNTDKPYPRGELLVKSKYQVTEYFKDPEATAALLDEEGFSCTGDIVEERAPDHVVIIDRRKDVLKLSQGEYVAVGTLGTVFEAGSSIIKQIYVYGSSLRSYLLAVVVPDELAVATKLGDNPSEADLRALIREELIAVGRAEDLKTFEVPRDFIVEHDPFTSENGLLTSVRKKRRPGLKEKYGDQLESLYEEQSQNQQNAINALKDPNSALSTLDKLAVLLETNLGRFDIDIEAPHNYDEMGGDSLGAVELALSIEDVFGVNLPADTILSPTASAKKWAEEIDTLQASEGAGLASFESVHGKDATVLKSADITLERFLETDVLEQAQEMKSPADVIKNVLVTGANGFLGHIVALQWMEKVAPLGGKVICLVRGRDDKEARQRLDKAFGEADKGLIAHYSALADKHLEVIAGDVSRKNLGLTEDQFADLAKDVDRIAHVGALVNHRLEYNHLFAPNVAGTAEIIRLAITNRRKGIDFVSTQAVLAFIDLSEPDHETAPLCSEIALQDRYAMGYAASKWASEHLLQDACHRFSIPVNIIRGGMMLPHQSYVGQINISDTFTRLLMSIVLTGLAPKSFYPMQSDGNEIKGHYEGLPGDVVAASVVAAGEMNTAQVNRINLCNFNYDDNCSLDSFVNAIESVGYDVERLDDYQEWHDRFIEKMQNLPEDLRQASALNIMGAYASPSNPGTSGPSCDNFKKLLPSMSTGERLPHLDETYIHKCLMDMQALGLIEGPNRVVAKQSA